MRQRIVQISDMHLFAKEGAELLGVNTEESFRAVLDYLKKDPVQPTAVILSGDLTQDAEEGAYLKLAEHVKALSTSVYYVPGNHDDSRVIAQIFPRDNLLADKHIVLAGWDIILLNTQRLGEVPGYLAAGELAFLQNALEANPGHRALIIFHHPPLQVGCSWLDSLSLQNADEFWSIASQHPRIHSVLFGHIHQEYETLLNGVRCFGVPSTCIQFKRKSPNFALENLPQGYRWMDVYPDGRFATGVERLPTYVGRFEANPSAY